MSLLKELYLSHTAKINTPDNRHTDKFIHYMDIYDEVFVPFRDKEVTFLEVGSGVGGFLQIAKKYFGSKAKIYGIDYREDFIFEEEQIKVFFGSQLDRDFLQKTAKTIGNIDIIIDDCGHESVGQIATFEEFISCLNAEHGIYVCEDVHTSYQPQYMSNSFMDYMKKQIDKLNLNNSPMSYHSLHFYPYLIILKKSLEITGNNESNLNNI